MTSDIQNIDPRLITLGSTISLTRFTGAPGTRLTKRFVKNEQGQIIKESQPQFFGGEAETISLKKLSDIEDVTDSLLSNQCISTGVFDRSLCPIVIKKDFSDGAYDSGTRTRSKDHMNQPDSGLILLDYDTDRYMPESMRCTSPDELMTKLINAIPELEGVGYSAAGSSSNGIFDESTGEPYQGGGGMHIYIAVKGIDLDQLQRTLPVKLWNAGLGYISFARNGAMLERTLFDLSVLSPERLIFEAKPQLSEGIAQKERVWTHMEGNALAECPKLTDEEVTSYKLAIGCAKADESVLSKSGEMQRQHRDEQVQRLSKERKITVEQAEKQIPKRTQEDLGKSEQPLYTCESVEIDGTTMLVSELVKRGKEFDGKPMPDPIEGNSYGTTTAMYYHNDGISPRIHSFAHGMKTLYKIVSKGAVIDAANRFMTVATRHELTDLNVPLITEAFPHIAEGKNGACKPLCTIENVEHLLKSYGIRVAYDVIEKEIYIKIPGMSGISENSANTSIETINSLATLNGMSFSQVPRYVAVIADRNAVNPIANWIVSKPWDGKDRLQEIAGTITVRDDYPDDFKDVLITKWLLSAVAAATLPSGFHSRGILTIQGAQGIGKTSWVRQLMPAGLLRDKSILTGHHLDPSNKDSLTTAIKSWIVEMGELDSSFRKDIARLKGFATQDKDKVRRPYARTDSEYTRRTVFCATVNEENFLVDPTGNSRFWTLPVVKIDYEHDIDMQQVFAQLYVKLKQGSTWWLTPEEEKRLEKQNLAHKSVSVIEERVLDSLIDDLPDNRWQNMSASEVLQAAGISHPTNPQARECGALLRHRYGPPKKIQGIYKWRVPIDSNRVRI